MVRVLNSRIRHDYFAGLITVRYASCEGKVTEVEREANVFKMRGTSSVEGVSVVQREMSESQFPANNGKLEDS